MPLNSLGRYPYTSFLNLQANGICSSIFLDQVLRSFLVKSSFELEWNILLELPGQFPSCFSIKSVFKSMENAPGASCANSSRFPYEMRMRNLRKMLMELLGSIPLHFFMKSSLQVNGKCSCDFLCQSLQVPALILSWKLMENGLAFLYQSVQVNGKCSWSFLGMSFQVSSFNL